MTKRMKFFYNGLLLTAVGFAMRGVQLLFGAYISRAVGAEGVGLNTLIMTVYSFALTFATSGISLTVTRLTATAIGESKPEEQSRILKGAALYSFGFSLVGTVALFFLSGVIGTHFLADPRTTMSLQILAFSLIPAALSSVISGYFVGVRRVSLNAVVQVLGQIFKLFFTVFLLFQMAHLGTAFAVAALAIATTVSEILCFLVALVEFLVDRRRAKAGKGADITSVAAMAFPLAVSAYIRSALLSLEHSLIPKRLRRHGESYSEALSSYGSLHGMALPLILYPLTPLTSFSGLLVPEFAQTHAEGKNERMRRLTERALNSTLTYAIAVSVFIYIFSEELGYVIYGSYEAGHYIGMLAPVIPIMYLDHVTDAILKGIGEHIYSMWVNIADACLSVVLVYILIPIMGIAGYAVVIIAMEAFNFLMSFLRLRRRIRFSIHAVSAILVPLTAAVLSALLSRELFVFSGSETTVFLLVMKATFAVCAFIAVQTVAKAALALRKYKKNC